MKNKKVLSGNESVYNTCKSKVLQNYEDEKEMGVAMSNRSERIAVQGTLSRLFFISIVAFPKVPGSVHCSTSSMHQSCSTSLSDIFLTRTATLTILGYI